MLQYSVDCGNFQTSLYHALDADAALYVFGGADHGRLSLREKSIRCTEAEQGQN